MKLTRNIVRQPQVILPIILLALLVSAFPVIDHTMREKQDKLTSDINHCSGNIEKIYLWWSVDDQSLDIREVLSGSMATPEINNGGNYNTAGKPGPAYSVNLKGELTDWLDLQINYQVNRICDLLKTGTEKSSTIILTKVKTIQSLYTRKISLLEQERTQIGRDRDIGLTIIVLLIFLISIRGMVSFIRKGFKIPARQVLHQVEKISEGDFARQSLVEKKDVFGEISGKIENVRQHISDISQFIQRIGEGDFNTSDLNISPTNLLGSSLIQMQMKLKSVAEEDKRRNWVNEGLARFSEILRKHNDDLEALSEDMILNLTRYLNVNQAALYLLKEESGEPVLESMSTYAWDRKKYIKDKFGIRENLIGQAIMEKDIIYMSDVPDGFVHITSGLGKANPREILIVPMIINEEPQGVIELASFNRFEPHMIEFVKHVSENIASTIVGIKTNNRTRGLLLESQEMTNQLKKQEEELRKNTRDLSDAKENLNIQLEQARTEMQMQIQKIEAEREKNIAILEGCEDGVITFKSNGIIDFFNKAAEDIWRVPREKTLGKHIRAFIPVEIMDSVDIPKVIYVGEGNSKTIDSRTEISVFDANGQEISVLATLSIGKLEEEATFAFFIQKISVEFF